MLYIYSMMCQQHYCSRCHYMVFIVVIGIVGYQRSAHQICNIEAIIRTFCRFCQLSGNHIVLFLIVACYWEVNAVIQIVGSHAVNDSVNVGINYMRV